MSDLSQIVEVLEKGQAELRAKYEELASRFEAREKARELIKPRLVSQRDVLFRLGGIHRTTLRSWIEKGEFPPPDKTVGGRNFWKEETVDGYFK